MNKQTIVITEDILLKFIENTRPKDSDGEIYRAAADGSWRCFLGKIELPFDCFVGLMRLCRPNCGKEFVLRVKIHTIPKGYTLIIERNVQNICRIEAIKTTNDDSGSLVCETIDYIHHTGEMMNIMAEEIKDIVLCFGEARGVACRFASERFMRTNVAEQLRRNYYAYKGELLINSLFSLYHNKAGFKS